MKRVLLSFIILATTFSAGAQSTSSIISELNTLFANYAYYKLVWTYNSYNRTVQYKGPNCTVTIPLNNTRVYYNPADDRNSNEPDLLKFFTDYDITEDCNYSGKKTTRYTIVGMNNTAKAKRAKELFLLLINDKGSSYSSSSGSKTYKATWYNSVDIDWNALQRSQDSDLKYVNDEFDKYNDYETQWFIDKNRQVLIHRNEFGYNEIDLTDAEAAVYADKKWFVIRCKRYDECLVQKGKDGDGSTRMKEYSMSLNSGSNMASTIYKVADALNRSIQNAKSSRSSYSSNSSSSSNWYNGIGIDWDAMERYQGADMQYVNAEFKKYNQYSTQWFIDKNRKVLIHRNEFGYNEIDLADAEAAVYADKKWFVIRCKRNDECLRGRGKDGRGSEVMKEYSMSLNSGDNMASSIYKVADALNRAIQSAR